MRPPPAPPPATELGAAVLCGGRSERMGTAKASLPFGGRTLLEHVVDRVRAAAQHVVVVAAPDQPLPTFGGAVTVLRDPVAHQGPLLGLAVALEALAPRCAHAFVTGTDAPLLAPALVRRLYTLACETPGCDITFVRAGGHDHPLCAVYRTGLGPRIGALLEGGERRLMALLAAVHACPTSTATLLADPRLRRQDPELRSLLNVNTPTAYAEAEEEWRLQTEREIE